MSGTIRELFSPRRPIDRQIEKVIDYYVQEDERLLQEINEYEITDNIESSFRKFLEAYMEGVSGGNVPEVGIWVSGFYGSGKSSFTKYLGAALDPNKKIGDTPFLELLCDRFSRNEIPALLRSVSKKYPTAIVMLDLGAEQLVDSTAESVSNVLYWKVMQWAGFSKEKKTAQLEFTLERRGLYDQFKEKYREKYNSDWSTIQNDPLIAVNRAAEIVPMVLPEEFPDSDSFRKIKFEEARDLRGLVAEIIELVRKKTGLENIILLIDEAGQYVAPRGELILNLDGLSRNIRELGLGKVWVVATGQQTLSEIVQKALHNSAELNKLKDRFPISITLDAGDIREITYRRLLEKSEAGNSVLKELFAQHGQSLITHTRLNGTILYREDPNSDQFIKLYPFLPQHFELLLELIRNLARSTGGIGLRSAIRVIQDALVDKSRVLPAGTEKLADKKVGALATVDHFYDTLQTDIAKNLVHVVDNVNKIIDIFGAESWEAKAAKAIAVLQVLDNFPRNSENIAALLYDRLGSQPCQVEVREALTRLLAQKECGLIDDPQSGGYIFLSDAVKPIRDKRNSYNPTGNECLREEVALLKEGNVDYPLFRNQPSARVENIKEVKASVKYSRSIVKGGSNEDLEIRLEYVAPEQFQAKREEYLVSSNAQNDLKNTVILLAERNAMIDDALIEIVKSDKATEDVDERSADRDLSQYIRSERRLADSYREVAAKEITKAVMNGIFIFRGKPTPVRESGESLDTAVNKVLSTAAKAVFDKYHLAPIRPATDVAVKFLEVERLDRVTSDRDPLKLVITSGSPKVDVEKPVLAEVIRIFNQKVSEAGTGRLQGNILQDLFSSAPYGWTKDTIRYLFAALLRAGVVELHKAGADGPIKTTGQLAVDAVKSTVEFSRVGVSIRDSRPAPEVLNRAAHRLETLFGDQVLPLEDRISEAVRKHMPSLVEKFGSLPDRLRLLKLPGEERARQLLTDTAELLKGDAGDAAAHLGGHECKLLDEIKWGKKIYEALETGAENDVNKANAFITGLNTLENNFPNTLHSFISVEDLETINEIMHSDIFYERLPELRQVIRRAEDRICSVYDIEYKIYQEAIECAVVKLETERGWINLNEEERAENIDRLNPVVQDKADRENPAKSLNIILTRRHTMASVLEDLTKQVRAAEKDLVITGNEGPIPASEDIVIAVDLIEPRLIENDDDLDGWLAELRVKIVALLKQNKRVRIEK